VTVGADGTIVEVSLRAAELFGYAPGELVGRPVEMLVPEARQAAHAAHRRLFAEDRGQREMGDGKELAGRRRDGSTFPAEIGLRPVPGSDGETVAVVRDISRRILDEERTAYLTAILASGPDAMYSQDRDGLLTGWNTAAEALFGYAAGEVAGWRSTRLFAEHRWADHEVVLRRVLAGEVNANLETEIRCRDGQLLPVVLHLAPIRARPGRIVGASVIARDLTEQRLALELLAESEARLRENEALVHVGRWVLDVATGSVQWSEEQHRLHGLRPLEFEETRAAHLAPVHPDDRPTVEEALDRAIATAGQLDLVHRVLLPDGTGRLLRTRGAAVLGPAGEVIGVRGVCQDISAEARAASGDPGGDEVDRLLAGNGR